jgi:hypothetical protein
MLRLIGRILLIMVALAFGSANAAEVGDHVLLVERDTHILAHPAPGDSAVPFRLSVGPKRLSWRSMPRQAGISCAAMCWMAARPMAG